MQVLARVNVFVCVAWRAVPEGTLVISRSRLMVLNLHRPIMAGIDYCSRRNRDGKLEPWAVTSIIESGGYEDDEDEGDVLWYTGDCKTRYYMDLNT